jgi:hypothetical protein
MLSISKLSDRPQVDLSGQPDAEAFEQGDPVPR